MPTRQRQLIELATQSNAGGTNPQVRTELEIYSSTEVDSLIAGLDLTPYATTALVADISGNLSTSIADISGSLSLDIDNLDVSLTDKIATDCVQSAGVSGAATTIARHLEVTINGVPYKIGVVD